MYKILIVVLWVAADVVRMFVVVLLLLCFWCVYMLLYVSDISASLWVSLRWIRSETSHSHRWREQTGAGCQWLNVRKTPQKTEISPLSCGRWGFYRREKTRHQTWKLCLLWETADLLQKLHPQWFLSLYNKHLWARGNKRSNHIQIFGWIWRLEDNYVNEH